jgi:HEAT repeat protein/beta-lactamase regulating signal transducer with metallopeptidase domain
MIPAELTTLLTGLDGVFLPAVDALVKVTLVLGAAAIVTFALGGASAATRHLVWSLALASAVVIPVLSFALPRWQLPIITLTTVTAPALPEEIAPPIAPAFSRRAHTPEPASPIVNGGAIRQPAPSQATTRQSVVPRISLSTALLGIWAAGVVVVLARLLLGLVAVQWMSRRTVRVVDAPWLPLARELADDLGITRRLMFLESARATMPMAAGVFTPTVLMPEDANRWPLERLRIVLLHELAHVKRRDCLTHVIAQTACALHWFNPLAWIAARHIRTERERACDDLVLACGTDGPDYAEELLEIARVMRAGRYPLVLAGATLAMAHRSQLEGRLIAILDPKVPRAGVSRSRAALATALVAIALPPIATMQPWAVATVEGAAIVGPDTPRPASQVLPAAAPSPAPEPRPQPAPHAGAPATAQTAATTSVSAAHSIAERAEATAESAVQTAIQSGVQSTWQTIVQGAVQGAVQGVHEAVQAQTSQASQGAQASQSAQTTQGAQAKQEGKRGADPRMVAALTAALKDSDKEVRETAMHALVQLRDPAIFEPLVQALKDPSPDVREQAAHGLGQLRDKRAVDPLMGALKDTNAGVRENAVHALSQLRDPRAVDALVLALKDENPSVREQAAFALGQIRDTRATDALIGALKDANADVRQQAVFALGQLRDKRAASALAPLIKDSDADVREQAVFALGQLRDPAAIDGLVAALRDAKPDVREQAAFALGQIRDPRAVQALISSLKDENADVREQAAFALGQLRDRTAVEALVVAIKDPAADVREQVAFALGQLRDPRAIDALTEALKDASSDVRQQAAFALGQLIR